MKKTLAPILLYLLFVDAMAQENLNAYPFVQSNFLEISVNANHIQFRDFVSSPLYYNGITSQFNLALVKKRDKMERSVGLSYSSGNVSNDDFNQITEAEISSFSFHYHYLKHIEGLSSNTFNTKIGGLFDVLGNYRTNEKLNNYGISYEIIPTLFLSARTEVDVSRKEQKNIFFDRIRLLPRKRLISYQLDFGLLNSNFRVDQSYLINSSVSNDLDFIAATRFNGFSGFRFSSLLEYTISLKNSNAYRISYGWSVLTTGNDRMRFEQSNHFLGISILFNTKNK